MPTGPDLRMKITEEYARHVGKDAYFRGWPMANIFNRRIAFKDVREGGTRIWICDIGATARDIRVAQPRRDQK